MIEIRNSFAPAESYWSVEAARHNVGPLQSSFDLNSLTLYIRASLPIKIAAIKIKFIIVCYLLFMLNFFCNLIFFFIEININILIFLLPLINRQIIKSNWRREDVVCKSSLLANLVNKIIEIETLIKQQRILIKN